MTKRLFDIFFSLVGLLCLGAVLMICVLIASIDTKSFGLFCQKRIGQYGIPFTIYKIKSLLDGSKKITAFGSFLRAYKLDELPQLINVLLGDMSFVGPRPDVAGYADQLIGEDRMVLNGKPGITGLASIKYRNEEELLQQQKFPLAYNDEIIYPDKVRINKWYLENHNFKMDLLIVLYTVFPSGFDVEHYINNYQI
ncbi:lipopolysaccharide/colanic/teichoic acid biosynthesis glycosyltransferase [Flavobacterium sp. PL11]|uniref:sugar transferase n=1 Tax=Flavobacterium sp. PL11 TaxID=3071717 RepID=UPI002DFF9E4B|nr:lipopolysaccharide/colanic/teichoic acid biosynthesis glycosyltransferase [Flavobacterium sp. PL11]